MEALVMRMLETVLLGGPGSAAGSLAQAEGRECLSTYSELCPQICWEGGCFGQGRGDGAAAFLSPLPVGRNTPGGPLPGSLCRERMSPESGAQGEPLPPWPSPL